MFSRRLLLRLFCSERNQAPKLQKLVQPQSQKVCGRNVFTSPAKSAKIFRDTENTYAHEVLEYSLKRYQIFQVGCKEPPPDQIPALVLDPTCEESPVVDDVYKSFCALVHMCAAENPQVFISEDRFKPFTKLFCRVSEKLSDEQLLGALSHLALLPPPDTVKAPNYVEIWNTLDVVCASRITKWNTNELLMYCDAWYTLNLGRICDFTWEALRKLGRKIRRMQPAQLVHTMFFCNVVRQPVSEMFDFELNFDSSIDSMTLQEIGVMAMGFFKTQTSIRNQDLVTKIYYRLIKEVDDVGDMTLVSLMKVLRYSSKLVQVDVMMELLEKLCPQIERLSLLSCLHIALLGSDVQVCHERCLELILQRFQRELEQARLKDLERMSLVLSVFNYSSPSGVERVVSVDILKQLQQKVDEIMKHPTCFPRCLHFLSIKGFYDMELISSALESNFLRHAYGKSLGCGREIFHLDSFVKINLKDANYTGNSLNDNIRRTMGKLLTQYIPERNSKYKLSHTDRLLLEIKANADNIFRTWQFKHVLPHFERPDIVVCYDRKARKAIDLSPNCPANYSGIILTRKELLGDKDCEDIDTIVLVIAGWNNVVRETDRFTGLFDLKLNQLKLLGHKYVVIHWEDWRNLETPKDRELFIKRKLSTVTHL